MKKLSVIVCLGLALVVLLSACGGGGAQTSFTMTMADFSFQPVELTVPANKSITLTIVNSGTVEHDWVLVSKTVTPPFGDKDKGNVIAQKLVSAGQTATLTFTSPNTPGDYEIICSVAGHLESGMKATLHVTQ